MAKKSKTAGPSAKGKSRKSKAAKRGRAAAGVVAEGTGGQRVSAAGNSKRRKKATSYASTWLPDGAAANRGVERAGKAITDAGTAVAGTIAANPIPAALIGAGVAWLLLSGRAGDLKDRAAALLDEPLDGLSDRLNGAAVSLRDAFTGSVNGLGDSLQSGSKKARKKYKKGLAAASDAFDRHPLATGAAILATGLAVGLLLPATVSENGVLGRQSDALKQRARQASKGLVKRGRKVSKAIGEAVDLESVGATLGATDVIRNVRKLAAQVQDATMDVARKVHLAPSADASDADDATGRNDD